MEKEGIIVVVTRMTFTGPGTSAVTDPDASKEAMEKLVTIIIKYIIMFTIKPQRTMFDMVCRT